MPDCGYCSDFKDDWNKVVQSTGSEYGDKVIFVKINGEENVEVSHSFNVHRFPAFVALEPGNDGKKWTKWMAPHRDFAGMQRWIKNLTTRLHLDPLGMKMNHMQSNVGQNRNNDSNVNKRLVGPRTAGRMGPRRPPAAAVPRPPGRMFQRV